MPVAKLEKMNFIKAIPIKRPFADKPLNKDWET